MCGLIAYQEGKSPSKKTKLPYDSLFYCRKADYAVNEPPSDYSKVYLCLRQKAADNRKSKSPNQQVLIRGFFWAIIPVF
jgi:hypothetical protein